ncbi:COX assembly mitochondrial protein homolog isoform X1 [Rhinichthys klamathensis goyatoka]|uniref:COX assembly mitochondrial protein homolog isoform X1 n=1 Tax=Rhinichthys klamathensis goyatoka TaxID=3034132 RepID=UPI0024B4A863|nr:COX assembly mitochondrial protein homolog isoform X1 [Rhinichthys klamathensis goyatoka]
MDPSKAEEPPLRHVETDVLIPKMMREKAKERCVQNVDAFNRCCKDSGFFMVFKCREENAALKECLTRHYLDPVFFEECKQEYLTCVCVCVVYSSAIWIQCSSRSVSRST